MRQRRPGLDDIFRNYFALNVDPSQALPGSYNYALVLLSYLVAALGSYAFLQFATRIAELRDAGLRYSWLVDRRHRHGRRHLGDALHRHAGPHPADPGLLRSLDHRPVDRAGHPGGGRRPARRRPAGGDAPAAC